jgi:hypothetical protein
MTEWCQPKNARYGVCLGYIIGAAHALVMLPILAPNTRMPPAGSLYWQAGATVNRTMYAADHNSRVSKDTAPVVFSLPE